MWTKELQMYKPRFEEAEKPKIALTTFVGESKGVPEKNVYCFIDYAKAFDCVSQPTVENS